MKESKFGILLLFLGIILSDQSSAASSFGVYGAKFKKEGVYLHVPTCKNRETTLEDIACSGTAVSGLVTRLGRRRRVRPDWLYIGCDWSYENTRIGEAGCAKSDEYVAWGKELFIKYSDINIGGAPDDAPETCQEWIDKGYLVSYTGIRRDVVTKDMKVFDADLRGLQ